MFTKLLNFRRPVTAQHPRLFVIWLYFRPHLRSSNIRKVGTTTNRRKSERVQWWLNLQLQLHNILTKIIKIRRLVKILRGREQIIGHDTTRLFLLISRKIESCITRTRGQDIVVRCIQTVVHHFG
jgi:hypothetical protein